MDKGQSLKAVNYINSHSDLDQLVYSKIAETYVHPMEYAAYRGDSAVVNAYIQNADKIEDFHTLLSKAFIASFRSGQTTVINQLYQLEPNINETSSMSKDQNAIMTVVELGLDEWYFKLKATSEMLFTDKHGNTVLHLASAHYRPRIMKDLLRVEGIKINQLNTLNRTALQMAAIHQSAEAFDLLLNNGGKYHQFLDFSADALMSNQWTIFEHLLNQTQPKFNPWIKASPYNSESLYPIFIAIQNANSEIPQWIINHCFNEIKQNKNPQHIRLFYEWMDGANPVQLYTPLAYIIQQKNKDLFVYLFKVMVEFNQLQLTFPDDTYGDNYEQNAQIYFSRFDYKDAKHQFGETFTDSLYQHYQIDF